MEILFFVPYIPNLVRVRSYNLIRSLANRGNKVTLATLWVNESEKAGLEALRDVCAEIHAYPQPTWRSLLNGGAGLLSGQPLQAWYSWNSSAASRLAGVARHPNENRNKYDVIHIEHLRGVKYALALQEVSRRTSQPLPPIVWDSVDCISYLFRQAAGQSRSMVHRFISLMDLRRTEGFERRMTGRFDRMVVTSEIDKQAFINLCQSPSGCSDIAVIPNGVDLDYFRPNPDVRREPDTIVFSGKMSYHANITMIIHFVEQILPLVWKKRPQVKLRIVGKDPSTRIKAMADHPNITVTGTVNDMRPYLQAATMAVVPMVYGAGSQLKLLENMACATPVVASSRAARPIQAVAGRDLLVADDPQDFADRILSLMENPELCASIGNAGRKYVERCHDWAGIAQRLEEVYYAVT